MKHYLLSTIGALLLLAGASTLEARAEVENEVQNEPQTQAQPPSQPAQDQLAAKTPAEIDPQGQATVRPVCGRRSTFVTQLKERYAETPVSIGLASNGAMIEIFAASSGSFSILVTRPEGISCMVTSGDNWQALYTRKADLKI